MEAFPIQVEPRQRTGTGAARSLRRAGKVPGILYGRGRPPRPVAIDVRELARATERVHTAHLLQLRSGDPEVDGRMAVFKEVQRHPVSEAPLHVDLYQVDLATKLRVPVPLKFVGHAAGVELGGILQPVRREIEVLCLPTDIPDAVEVDVSPLGIHDSLHGRDLRLPPGVEISTADAEVTIVTVLPPVVEEGAAAAAPAEEAAAAPAAEAPPAAEEG